MVSNQLKINSDVEELTLFENSGNFMNNEGKSIVYKNVTGTIKLGGKKLKIKIDKKSMDMFEYMVEEGDLER